MPESTQVQPANKLPTAYGRLAKEYESQGNEYGIAAHYYFSTGAFEFQVVQSKVDPNGFTRLFIRGNMGSVIQFFSYGINDDVGGVGLSPNIKATDSETNLAERQQTNNEDYAIEGIAAGARGVRISYPAANAQFIPTSTGDANLRRQIVSGDYPWCDLGSTFLPPELSSPIALHDALFEHIGPFCSLQIFFDRKASDHICRLDKIPQGGGRSYLHSNGEPSAHNIFRIPDGYSWRASSQKTDRLLLIEAKLTQDVYANVTLPALWQGGTVSENQLGAPGRLWLEWSLWLHGRSFYTPGRNV
jgi:hypothetical protein